VAFIPEVREVVKALDVENILVETDAPYMSPFKGERNKPYYVKFAIEEIAKIKDMSVEEVERITHKNAVRFFKLNLR
jgi:TatD DNase family protein